jgi:hypothetical protein
MNRNSGIIKYNHNYYICATKLDTDKPIKMSDTDNKEDVLLEISPGRYTTTSKYKTRTIMLNSDNDVYVDFDGDIIKLPILDIKYWVHNIISINNIIIIFSKTTYTAIIIKFNDKDINISQIKNHTYKIMNNHISYNKELDTIFINDTLESDTSILIHEKISNDIIKLNIFNSEYQIMCNNTLENIKTKTNADEIIMYSNIMKKYEKIIEMIQQVIIELKIYV